MNELRGMDNQPRTEKSRSTSELIDQLEAAWRKESERRGDLLTEEDFAGLQPDEIEKLKKTVNKIYDDFSAFKERTDPIWLDKQQLPQDVRVSIGTKIADALVVLHQLVDSTGNLVNPTEDMFNKNGTYKLESISLNNDWKDVVGHLIRTPLADINNQVFLQQNRLQKK